MNDFEKHIKDKLEMRSIQPSADAWKKIQTQLEPKPKRRNPQFWIAAASIMLVFGIGVSYLTSENKSGAVQMAVQKKEDRVTNKKETQDTETAKDSEFSADKGENQQELAFDDKNLQNPNIARFPQPTESSEVVLPAKKPVVPTKKESHTLESQKAIPEKVDLLAVERKRLRIKQEAELLLNEAQEEISIQEMKRYAEEKKSRGEKANPPDKDQMASRNGSVRTQLKNTLNQTLDDIKEIVVLRY